MYIKVTGSDNRPIDRVTAEGNFFEAIGGGGGEEGSTGEETRRNYVSRKEHL